MASATKPVLSQVYNVADCLAQLSGYKVSRTSLACAVGRRDFYSQVEKLKSRGQLLNQTDSLDNSDSRALSDFYHQANQLCNQHPFNLFFSDILPVVYFLRASLEMELKKRGDA